MLVLSHRFKFPRTLPARSLLTHTETASTGLPKSNMGRGHSLWIHHHSLFLPMPPPDLSPTHLHTLCQQLLSQGHHYPLIVQNFIPSSFLVKN